MSTHTATTILTEANKLGLKMWVHLEKVRYRPQSSMTPELAQRMKDHKTSLLEHLKNDEAQLRDKLQPAADNTPGTTTTITPADPAGGVLSVLSVSEPEASGNPLWSEDELALLGQANATLDDMPMAAQLKSVFSDIGLVLVSIEKTHGRGGQARRHAAQLIRQARQANAPADPDLPIAMRDAWEERMAICTIDGGLTEHQAEDIALQHLKDYNSLLRKHVI